MRLFKPLAALASLSLVATPVLAQSAAPLSLARAGASTDETSRLSGDFIIPGIVLAAIVAGAIIILIEDDEDDAPVSP